MQNVIKPMRKQRVAILLGGALLTSCIWNALEAFAEIKNTAVKVEGLTCPFCAFGLEKKLAQVAGATESSADLKTGTVNLNFAEKAVISVHTLSEAVRQAGFTMGPVTVTAIGVLKEKNDRLVLSVRDSRQEFLLFEDSAREKEAHSGQQPKLLTDATRSALQKLRQEGAVVAVTGKVHDRADGPVGLLVERYEVVK